ncbi:MAG: CoA-binding protein [Candidatus Woesearchaeota archaeon]
MNKLFNPKSVAVVGASRYKAKVGYGVIKNLVKGGYFKSKFNKPFKGRVYPVNPHATSILGLRCYKSLAGIRGEVDLAVIAVQASLVPRIMDECLKKKVKAVIVISAGFAELGEKGKELQQQIADKARGKITLVGPNCLGVIHPSSGLNASFAPAMPPSGNVAFISQSGALADSVIDWAISSGYGFSKLISYGNAALVGINDLVEYFSKDKETKAIAIYLEGLKDGRRFMRAAKGCKKPIIVLKAGKTEHGMKAIGSHTGSLAGSYEVYMAAFRQCGVKAAETLEELFSFADVLASQPRLKKNSVAIITNGGGCGVLCADYCESEGLKLAKLSEKMLKKIDRKMHPAYSRSNPLDLVGDALPERYGAAINAVLGEKNVSGAIVIQTLQTMTDTVKDAQIVVKAKNKFKKPVLAVFLGGKLTEPGVELLKKNNVPCYAELKDAARAMRVLLSL